LSDNRISGKFTGWFATAALGAGKHSAVAFGKTETGDIKAGARGCSVFGRTAAEREAEKQMSIFSNASVAEYQKETTFHSRGIVSHRPQNSPLPR
jgi:hypothetical protein